MKTTNDGGPAFPAQPIHHFPDGITMSQNQGGMTLRDYFAGQALAGICVPAQLTDGPITDWEFDKIAPVAWKAADAMLAAREGKL
jgi:hypothetical protein